MWSESTAVFLLIGVTAALMASNRIRFDVVALLVTLVVEPGSYRCMDFVKVGAPLLVLAWLTTLLVAPLVFPYSG